MRAQPLAFLATEAPIPQSPSPHPKLVPFRVGRLILPHSSRCPERPLPPLYRPMPPLLSHKRHVVQGIRLRRTPKTARSDTTLAPPHFRPRSPVPPPTPAHAGHLTLPRSSNCPERHLPPLSLPRSWMCMAPPSSPPYRAFDFAALLKLPGATPSSAVSAALVDVYGPDVAELVVLSTHPAHRGKGLAKVSLSVCVWVCWLEV